MHILIMYMAVCERSAETISGFSVGAYCCRSASFEFPSSDLFIFNLHLCLLCKPRQGEDCPNLTWIIG